jgi:UDP-2,4-diacetamido-2,4,6-trideoxy-beta-L-altropyranose hydrolase
MLVDDLADKVQDCDLLLDQNLVAQMQTRYADKVTAACVLFGA